MTREPVWILINPEGNAVRGVLEHRREDLKHEACKFAQYMLSLEGGWPQWRELHSLGYRAKRVVL